VYCTPGVLLKKSSMSRQTLSVAEAKPRRVIGSATKHSLDLLPQKAARYLIQKTRSDGEHNEHAKLRTAFEWPARPVYIAVCCDAEHPVESIEKPTKRTATLLRAGARVPKAAD